jgi:hypothetical protein
MIRQTRLVFLCGTALIGLMGANCGGPARHAPTSGIQGVCQVTFVSGVQPNPDVKVDSPTPRPFAGVTVRLFALDGDRPLAEGKSDAEGKFRLSVEPGTYRLVVVAPPDSAAAASGASPEPRMVEVTAGRFAEITLDFFENGV